MSRGDTIVARMTTSPARDRARDHLAASLAARDTLADLYGRGGTVQVDRSVVAELHETVRTGIKLAQVEALLAIGDRLDALLATGHGDVLVDLGLERVTGRAAS